MFGHASQPTRVYAYGARAPAGEHAETARAQLLLARRYRNALVEVEHERRRQADAIVLRHTPRLAELAAEEATLAEALEAVRGAIRERNSAERTREPRAEAQSAARELGATLRQVRAEIRTLRREAFAADAVRADLAGLDAETRERQQALRREYSPLLGWGTRAVVEHGLAGIRSGPPPRFVGRPWPGKLAVQFQADTKRGRPSPTFGDLLTGASHATQARVEVLPLPEGAAPGGRRSKRPRALLHLRIGSEGRAPVMVQVPFVLHRRPPADARVKWVYLVRSLRATHEEWSVQFVCAREAWAHADTAGASGVCGIDMGWRHLPDGSLRVAYVEGSDGYAEELRLPAEWLEAWQHAESLQSIRDREFALALARLRAWLAVQEELPEWLREATETLAQWRSPARLAGLAIRWRAARFDGDAEAFGPLEAWRAQDRHLYDWQAAERHKLLRRRDDLYRRFAARLRWRYERAGVEDTDWSGLFARPPAEEDTEAVVRRWQARMASPGRLREILQHGGPELVRRGAAGTTTTCHACGAGPAPDWDAVRERMYRCALGHVRDQDSNAALHLRDAANAAPAGGT